MPTYSKETALYDTGAIAADIDAAGDTADTYITAVDQNGIKVHAANNVGTNYAGIDATGMDVVKGGASVAKFGETTRIGRAFVSGASNNESHMELDYHSLQLVDKEGESYFHVSDLRGSSGSISVEDVYTGDGSTTKYYYSKQADNPFHSYEGVHITVSDSSVNRWSIHETYVDFATPPSDGSTITITYTSTNQDNKAFTFGERVNGSNIGALSVAEGSEVTASGRYSHVEGVGSSSLGYASHSEGWQSTATGTAVAAHAEGTRTTASGDSSHSEGSTSIASGPASHAEGSRTTASRHSSHAEGYDTTASEVYSHAEGYNTTAGGVSSHAEGDSTLARGNYSHAQNSGTEALSDNQTTIGRYNDNDPSHAFEVGNGTADDARSNALAIKWNGTIRSGIAGYGATTWLALLKGNAALYVPKDPDAMSNPVGALVIETTAGGAWVVSNYTDEGIRFVYITAENRAADTNTTTMPIKINTDGTVNHLGDVGWTNLPLGSAVEAFSSGQTPQYRRVGQVVNLVGACKNKAQLASNGTLTLGTLPVGCRPHRDVIVLCQGSGQNKWCITASTSGAVTASRYSTGGTLVAATAGTWIPFNITFLV